MPHGHETFEHTADIGIRAWGNNFPEVFEEAAQALFNVIVDLKTVTPRQEFKVKLTAESEEELLLKWLQELLFISETKHIFFSKFKVSSVTPKQFIAEAYGEPADLQKHSFGREVKAITRHQFRLVSGPPRYLAEVILDI